MEKCIPYEKLSKKEKRKMDLAKRQTWGELNPVTRKPENSKAYNRRKTQGWKRELPLNPVFLFTTHEIFTFHPESLLQIRPSPPGHPVSGFRIWDRTERS